MVAKSREKILFFVVEDFTFLFFTHNELSGESTPKKALSANAGISYEPTYFMFDCFNLPKNPSCKK